MVKLPVFRSRVSETHVRRRAANMNGGRVAKRLLAVVLALSTLITLGLYYNNGSSVGGGSKAADDDRPRLAALSQRVSRGGDSTAAEWPATDAFNYLANGVADGVKSKKRQRASRPTLSATIDRDTCPEIGLANTTIDTVSQFSRFEFQVNFN